MIRSWFKRTAERLLGPVARATELLADEEALLALPPRAIESMTRRDRELFGGARSVVCRRRRA